MEGRWFSLQNLVLLIAFVTTNFQLCASDVVFNESFQELFEGRWTLSEKDDYEDIVQQLVVRLEKGLEYDGVCLPPQEGRWKPEELDSECPNSIMFGPDKCGSTNEVQFVLKHKNPKSGEYVEHHLKFPPTIPSNKPNNRNEDAPMEIEDEEAPKTRGWLDDECEEIDNLEASKPEEWDDEENSGCEAPKNNKPKFQDEKKKEQKEVAKAAEVYSSKHLNLLKKLVVVFVLHLLDQVPDPPAKSTSEMDFRGFFMQKKVKKLLVSFFLEELLFKPETAKAIVSFILEQVNLSKIAGLVNQCKSKIDVTRCKQIALLSATILSCAYFGYYSFL